MCQDRTPQAGLGRGSQSAPEHRHEKKALIGNLYRPGTLSTQGLVETREHDLPSLAHGVAIPHGFYDLQQTRGSVNLGTSHDTSELACDSLRQWWNTHGRHDSPQATARLLVCDGGGSNGARTSRFKADLEQFAQETGWEVRVAPYPPDTSTYNPLEQRLFPHLQRACQGVICTSIDWVKDLMAKATTTAGLRVSVNILHNVYQTGRQVAAEVKEQMRVLFDEEFPQGNYRVLPGDASIGETI